ncbi:hypothetical protein H0O01_02500 [Candidatus Micrarchaeota archaeon]|nr:hypothetical protein [Candidatus Micrarchaeota archaeon]
MQIKKMNERVSLFIDRKKELAELAENGKHVVIVGYRRMGKTHLILRHLVKSAGRKAVPVYMDMLYFASWEEFANALVEETLLAYDEVAGKDLSSLFRRFSSSVASALSSVNEIEAGFGAGGVNFLSLRLAFAEREKSEMELLKGALDFVSGFAEKNGVSVIIALDEIQNIQNFGDMERGLAIMRGEMQFTKGIRLIMSGSLPSFIHSEILEKSKPFWKQLKTMEVGPFGMDAVKEAAKATGVAEKHCEEVLALTRGIPDYVMKILMEMKKGAGASAAFEHIVMDEELFFSSIISSLSQAEHIIIRRIAMGEGYSRLEKAVGYPPTAVLNSLIRKGLVTRTAKGAYAVVDPGLEFVLKH